MPLKLLSKKSWHPGRAENIARVERDEREAAARARAQRAAQERGDLELLQQRAGLRPEHAPLARSREAGRPAAAAAAAASGPASAAAAAAAGVRLGEGSIEVGGGAVRAIHRYIQSGSSGGGGGGGGGSAGVRAAEAARAAARDALDKAKEDPLAAIRRGLGSSGSAQQPAPLPPQAAPALKRPRPEAGIASASSTIERLREERRLREAVESAKASLLMRQ